MTENEKTLARALERCVFFPGIGTKRFAHDMAFAAADRDMAYPRAVEHRHSRRQSAG